MSMFKRGDRVRNLEEGDQYIPFNATGTVDENNSVVPIVNWDEVTEFAKEYDPKNPTRWPQHQDYLELIEENKVDNNKTIKMEDLQKSMEIHPGEKGDARDENTNNMIYIGTKIVKAEPMSEFDFYLQFKNQDISDRETLGDGYKVTYEDGYVSWSPKKVFEQCYRLLSNSEIHLIRQFNL